MKERRQGLIDVFQPTPVGWIVIGVIILFLLVNPYHIIDRVFDLANKGVGYSIAINIVVIITCLPYYLRLRKKLRKYEDSKWDQGEK